MRELGMVIVGCMVLAGFFSGVIYPNLEYKGYPSTHQCIGECYEEYVRVHGTTVEIEQRKEVAQSDEFSSIKVYGPWLYVMVMTVVELVHFLNSQVSQKIT